MQSITKKNLTVILILKNTICPLCPRVLKILKGRGAISPPAPPPPLPAPLVRIQLICGISLNSDKTESTNDFLYAVILNKKLPNYLDLIESRLTDVYCIYFFI